MLDLSNKLCERSNADIPVVLVVDDNLDNLLFIGYALDSLNIKHLVSENGMTALDLAMDKLPDLILLDMVMPEADGMSIAKKLKRHLLTNHIPIIAVTGLTLAKHQAAIAEAGCDDYICKPLFIDQLEVKIAKHLSSNTVKL